MAREPLAELEVPERLRSHPAAVPDGPAGNIARAYARLAEAIREGTRFEPGFDHAVGLHRPLDALQRSSDEGRTVRMDAAG